MLTCQKHKFSLPDDVAYLNCAYMSPIPDEVEMAGYQAVSKKTLPYEITAADFFTGPAEAKKRFARLVNVEDFERIAIIPSVSYGIATVTQNIQPKPGQNIVLADEIFPSNYYSWQRLADESSCELRIVKAPATKENRGEKWNADLLQAIDNQTVAVTLPYCHWADGTRFDLVAVGKKCRETGAFFVVDGTQSVGAMPFDVQQIQPDALICAGYKWLLGPYSFGFAYLNQRFDYGKPLEENWITRLHSEDFQYLTRYQSAYQPKARRYDMGESSQFIGAPMAIAGLDLLLDWGAANIQEYCRRISKNALEELKEMGFWMEDEAWRGSHLFGIRLPEGVDLQQVKAKAAERQVFVSYRGDAVRVSPNVYNDEGDFERLAGVFREVQRKN